MDARIILAAQQPDFVNVLAQSNQAAQQRINFDQQNALSSTYRDQGPGILAGDPNALNALARLDPNAALGVQQTRLGMDATRQDMQFSAEKMQMARDQAAASARETLMAQRDKITKDQLATEQAQITSALSGAGQAYKAGDRAGYEAFLAAKGLDPAEYPFEQFPMIAATYEGVLSAMKEAESVFAGPDPKDALALQKAQVDLQQAELNLRQDQTPQAGFRAATKEEAAANGAAAGQVGPDGRFYPAKTQEGMVVYGPDGQPILTTGGATAKPFTEAQSKDVVYATRAKGALDALEPVADALASRGDIVADMVPLGLARGMQNPNFQLARQAGNEFLQAILRKDTGAAITDSEQASYGVTFLPQPGDLPQTLLAKKASRARAIAAIEAGMSPAQILAQERGLSKGDDAVPETGPDDLTPEEKAYLGIGP